MNFDQEYQTFENTQSSAISSGKELNLMSLTGDQGGLSSLTLPANDSSKAALRNLELVDLNS